MNLKQPFLSSNSYQQIVTAHDDPNLVGQQCMQIIVIAALSCMVNRDHLRLAGFSESKKSL